MQSLFTAIREPLRTWTSSSALRRFGAPLSDVSEADFSAEGIVIAQTPRRIRAIQAHSSSNGWLANSAPQCLSALVALPGPTVRSMNSKDFCTACRLAARVASGVGPMKL